MNPEYYKLQIKSETGTTRIECKDVIYALDLGFNLGNVMKYLWRAGKKDSDTYLQDLHKAAAYLKEEIARKETRHG